MIAGREDPMIAGDLGKARLAPTGLETPKEVEVPVHTEPAIQGEVAAVMMTVTALGIPREVEVLIRTEPEIQGGVAAAMMIVSALGIREIMDPTKREIQRGVAVETTTASARETAGNLGKALHAPTGQETPREVKVPVHIELEIQGGVVAVVMMTATAQGGPEAAGSQVPSVATLMMRAQDDRLTADGLVTSLRAPTGQETPNEAEVLGMTIATAPGALEAVNVQAL